jgi:glutathione synthase/RimK-type ligase-like ATP-grasp enzyme
LVVSEYRYASQAQPGGLISALRGQGVDVRAHFLEPDEPPDLVLPALGRADVVVARGRSEAVLAILDVARRLELPVVDSSGSIRLARDKAAMAARFRVGGLPAPDTFVGPLQELARRVPVTEYPLVVKPVFGDNGRDLHLVRDRRELRALEWSEPAALAQPYVPNDGTDLKIYCIAGRIWAVRKPSPLAPGHAGEAVPTVVTETQRTLARACAALFGMTVFGIDCVGSAEAPVVIEINDFPNFTVVEDADVHLARHVLSRAALGALVS